MYNIKKTYDIDYSAEVMGKHLPWGKPFVGGKIKALFVPGIRFGREFIELAQRNDIDFETVTIDRDWDLNKWGIGEFYDIRGAIYDFKIAYQNLENILLSDEKFDVIVLPGLNGWGHFSSNIRQAILSRVEAGTGLILVKPYTGKTYVNDYLPTSNELDILSPLKSLFEEGFVSDKIAGDGFPEDRHDLLKNDRWKKNDHYITNGIPFDLFPFNEIGYYPYEAKGEVIIKSESGNPIAAVKEYGRGRIVAFSYYPRNILPQHIKFTGRECIYESIIDNLAGSNHSLTFNYLEYFYSLIYRSMVWASRKESKLQIEKVFIDDLRVSICLNKQTELKYKIRIVDEMDVIRYEETFIGFEFNLPQWLKLGGNYRLDVFIVENDLVCDWFTRILNFKSNLVINKIELQEEVLTSESTLNSKIDISGLGETLEIQVLDDFDRCLFTQKILVVNAQPISFSWVVNNVASLHVRLRVSVISNTHILQIMDSKTCIITPQKRKVEDFEVFMVSMNRGQGDLLNLQREKSLNLGVTGAFPGSSKVLTMSGAEGLGIYWYHRFPYVARKEKFLASQDKKDLCRVPCLNAPDFNERNSQNIKLEVRKNRKFGPVSYYANDEGSLTCYIDEQDLCFCPHCMKEMREWLKAEYLSLDELNISWARSFSSWEEVIPYTRYEARRTQDFASWGDHRSFMELTFSNSYKRIKDLVRGEDSNGVIRMSGCQVSKTYTGYDYYQLHQHIGYFEAYGSGNQMEFHRSFAEKDTIIGAWIGYGNKGVNSRNEIWFGLLHGVTLFSLFFEGCHINPDFTYFQGAMDASIILKELRREGIAKLLLHTAKRDNLGIAIHYSMPSIHGSYILKDEKRFENSRQGWVSILEDLGYQYDFIASQQIEKGELISNKYKLLVLPYSIALSSTEATQIKQFVENGGFVLADFQTGIMDEHCKLYDNGSLDDLFGITRYTNEAIDFFGNAEFVQNPNFKYFDFKLSDNSGFAAVENGTRPNTGIHGYTDDFSRYIPSVIINNFGLGKTCYLNLSLSGYLDVRNDIGASAQAKQLIQNIIDLTGVKKPIILQGLDKTPINGGFETMYFSDGTAKYICFLREKGTGSKVGFDGLMKNSKEEAVALSNDFSVALPEKSHIYDVRNKKYFGFKENFDASIDLGDCAIYSILPNKTEGIELELSDLINRGETQKGKIYLIKDNPSYEYSNVMSVNVFNPDGSYEWIYSKNIILDQTNEFEFMIPYNEKIGIWKITAKDVSTGIAITKEFEIK